MTLAMCLSCGSQKFGAYVACPVCGFEPVAPIDKAKSMMLSDHTLDSTQLSQLGDAIRRGAQLPFDPVSLVTIIQDIEEEEYFWSRIDAARGVLPCKCCGAVFKAETSEIICPKCASKNEHFFYLCRNCKV